jgi:hypothetical protein
MSSFIGLRKGVGIRQLSLQGLLTLHYRRTTVLDEGQQRAHRSRRRFSL